MCDNEIKTEISAQVEMEMPSPDFRKMFRKGDTVHRSSHGRGGGELV